MKHFVTCTLAVLFTSQVAAQQVVTGTISGAEGKKLFLYSDDDNNPKDSAILKGGKFSFNVATPKEMAINALILEDEQNPLLFVTGKEPLHYVLNAKDFPMASAIKGDEDNRAMQAYQKSFATLIKRARDLNTEASTITAEDEAGKDALRAKAKVFSDDVVKTGTVFIKEHTKQLASLWVLINELRPRLEPAEFEKLYNSLSQPLKETKYGVSAAKYLRSVKGEGDVTGVADDFTQEDVNGRQIKLSSFRGKYVLVDFWASWCGPCRAENPNVVKAFNRFKSKNFTILGVSLDNNKDRWIAAIKQDDLQWTQVSDLKGWGNEVAQQYHISAIPANLLIDPQGRIVGRNLRGRALEAKLEQILK